MAKFCTYCGTQLEDDNAFCTKCGASQNGDTSSQQNTYANSNPAAKSKMAAGLLGIFLGAWGIHNFYLGNTGRGIAQIIVTIVTCGIGGIWGFIEGILILCGSIATDANGNPLQD